MGKPSFILKIARQEIRTLNRNYRTLQQIKPKSGRATNLMPRMRAAESKAEERGHTLPVYCSIYFSHITCLKRDVAIFIGSGWY